ncbi:unnamed protein product, partial [Mesorhabditis belari]|uniref:SF3A2 domain-containing protein n=1 Tax=Mesorhabditis belari TaxID=2138241 RepID=A0AAF3EPH5_9BILA
MLKLMESDGVEVRDLQGTETNEPYDFNELIEKANEYSNKDPPDVVEFSEKAWGAADLQSIEVGNAWAEVKNSRSRFYDIVKLMVKEAREALLESIKGMAATIEQAGLNKELISKGINLDDLLSKFFPKFEPVFTWQPAIKHFELNEVTFGSTLVFWEWKDVLEFFSPIISFKLVNVTANCNGRSDKVIKRDLLMCLEKHQIPRVHLNRLNFDFETKDNTELKYNLPIEYYEKGIFVIDTDSLLNELERWYLGKRKIEYWRIDVNSERAWKHLKEWINQKGTHVKKTQLGFVVTGAVKNQANQCSLKMTEMTKKILVNGIEVIVKKEDFGDLVGKFKDGVQVEDLEDLQSTVIHEPYDFNELIEKAKERLDRGRKVAHGPLRHDVYEEGRSYLAHTQGKKHQANLARRAAKEAAEQPFLPAPQQAKVDIKRFVKIGRPGYKVTRERDPQTGQLALLFQIDYPEASDGVVPRHRFMSAYEQKVHPPEKKYQYLLFAAEPYETIAFKIPSK